MVGRLARYLRFLGYDTEYARGLDDDTIARRAREEGRVLVTRDRELAARVPGALLLRSPHLDDQLRAVRASFPELREEVAFERCSLCNGRLAPWSAPADGTLPPELPRERVNAGLPIFACVACGHRYWEGGHTARIRSRLARAREGPEA